MESKDILFREVQRFHQFWLWALVAFLTGVSWVGFVQQLVLNVPFGTRPAPDIVVIGMWVLFGLVFPVMALIAGLITEVRGDGIYIRYIPFHRQFRTMPFDAIQTYETKIYRPLREYGGWGIRYGSGGKVYNVSGNRGVQLVLQSGRRILIGSQNPDALINAIDKAKRETYGSHKSQDR
jgi:hypothetical protein